MRSAWEVAFAKWCHSKGLHWHYEPRSFSTSKGTYLPDFYVTEWLSYVEVKGARLEKPMEKMKAFSKESGFGLIPLFEKDLRKMGVL